MMVVAEVVGAEAPGLETRRFRVPGVVEGVAG